MKNQFSELRRRLGDIYAMKSIFVSYLLLLRRVAYFFKTWPNPVGKSPMENLLYREWQVRSFKKLEKSEFSTTIFLEISSKILEAKRSDQVRVSSSQSFPSATIPISFSWPIEDWEFASRIAKTKTTSSVIPWYPYTFESYELYLKQYQESKYALTFKKGGWDCFRHLEIMASSSLPVMPDIQDCPLLTMHFYPKALFGLTLESIRAGEDLYESMIEVQSSWFKSHLISEQMAKYLLSQFQPLPEKVYFLDPGLTEQPDYLSVQIYSGLKQLLGKENVTSVFPADSVFEDWDGNAQALHGRGFGYTRILKSGYRNEAEMDSVVNSTEVLKMASSKDLLIIGDVSRNSRLAQEISANTNIEARKSFVWGYDLAPDRKAREWLESLHGVRFVREIY